MPMIDVYAKVGTTFAAKHQLAADLPAAVMEIEACRTLRAPA